MSYRLYAIATADMSATQHFAPADADGWGVSTVPAASLRGLSSEHLERALSPGRCAARRLRSDNALWAAVAAKTKTSVGRIFGAKLEIKHSPCRVLLLLRYAILLGSFPNFHSAVGYRFSGTANYTDVLVSWGRHGRLTKIGTKRTNKSVA